MVVATASAHVLARIIHRLDREMDLLWEVQWLRGSQRERPPEFTAFLLTVEDWTNRLARGRATPLAAYEALERACMAVDKALEFDSTCSSLPGIVESLGLLLDAEEAATQAVAA